MTLKFNLMQLSVMILLFITISVGCVSATIYTVGDTSGWDISTDLQSWVQSKTFLVGDSLLFQFSSYHSLVEVTRDDFDGCNTTNPLPLHSNTTSGNATVPLTNSGDRFFTCGNSLHCLGGMKLPVHVVSNQTNTVSPTGVPASGPISSRRGPSISNNPSSATGLLFKGSSNFHGFWMPSAWFVWMFCAYWPKLSGYIFSLF